MFLPQLPILISSDGKDKLKDDIILYRDHLLVRINTLWSYYKRLLKEFPLPFYTYLEQHWTELIKKSYREYLKVYNYNHDDLMSGNVYIYILYLSFYKFKIKLTLSIIK